MSSLGSDQGLYDEQFGFCSRPIQGPFWILFRAYAMSSLGSDQGISNEQFRF